MQKRFRAYFLAGALAALAPALPAQEVVDVPIAQARAIMVQAAQTGNPALAAEIARAILDQNPDDRDALVVLAVTAPQLGDPAAGRKAGARAWRLSETPAQRYEAARATALAANAGEQFTLATLWLRIALIHAPTPEERARTLRDAASVVRRNPWTTQLSFSLVPSNNVNGGAEDESCTSVGGLTCTLSEDALALAGWRASFGFATAYRLQQNAQSQTVATLRYQGQRVRITEDTAVPDEALRSDLGELSLRHTRALENGTVSGTVSWGRLSYRSFDLAADTLSNENYEIQKIGIDRTARLGERTTVTVGLQRERLTYSTESIDEVDRWLVNTGASYRFENGNRLTGRISFLESEAENTSYTFTQNTVSFDYAWGEPIGPFALSVGIGAQRADYPVFITTPDGREDETVFINMNIGFPEVQFAGFTPALRVDASRSNSNVSRFDRETASIGFTVSSQF